MLVIIEGMDKTGKSTLTEYLLKNLSNTYTIKSGNRPKDNSELEKQKIIDTYWKILGVYKYGFVEDILIVDRFLISEYVYCIKRGYRADDNEELKMIKDELEKMGDVVFVYCKTNTSNIRKAFVSDKEDYVKDDEIAMLLKRYDSYMSKIHVTVIPFDYTITLPKQVVMRLADYKERFDKRRLK